MTPIEIAESPHTTGCVDAGVDFSFSSASRKGRGLVSLLQIAGRANCSDENMADVLPLLKAGKAGFEIL